jgi:hypothetical protein
MFEIVMLDSTNFSAASWTAYTLPNITANLGTVEGCLEGVRP